MPLNESEAIVLRCYPLGEADRLVSFLSRSRGRMRGVAKGAKRPKSRFGSTLEPLSYIRMWFFERETRELVRINQCELLESFLDAQKDYTQGLALALLAEINEVVLPEHEASDASFRLTLLTARQIRATGKTAAPLLYFVLWTVKLAGWLPDLSGCTKCGKSLAGQPAFVSPARSGLACQDCRTPGLRTISRESMALAQKMLEQRLDKLDDSASGSGQDLCEYLLDVIEHHAERKLTARRMMETA
jgi:DNA repair protein RecO (recombination protein O)